MSKAALQSQSNMSRLALLLALGALLVPIFQYMPVQIELLRSTNIALWTLSSESLETTGNLRYIKDIYLLALAVLWPPLVIASQSTIAKKLMRAALGIELALVTIGLIGHLFNLIPGLILAGARWILLLHGSIGLLTLALAYGFHRSQNPRAKLNFTVLAIAFLCPAFACWQWIVLGLPELAGLRLCSFFANAGVLGFAMLGCAIYLLLSREIPLIPKQLGILSTFAGAMLSGTRGAMLATMIIFFISAFANSDKRNQEQRSFPISVVLIPILIGLISISLPYIEGAANRGAIIENQLDDGGRISNLSNLVGVILDSHPFYILFGKGLGYGTNSAMILFPELSGTDTWFRLIDNTLATLFLQTGILGLFLFLIATWAGLSKLYAMTKERKNTRLKLTFAVLAVSLTIVSGNAFENYLFLPLIFMAFAAIEAGVEYDEGGRQEGSKPHSQVEIKTELVSNE